MVDQDFRRDVARLCRHSRLRIVPEALPCRWEPTKVLNPETGLSFTTASAFEFIADKLEAGTQVTVVELRAPPGQIGYEMLITMPLPDGKDLYTKIQIGKNFSCVFGRSFHYSTVTGK